MCVCVCVGGVSPRDPPHFLPLHSGFGSAEKEAKDGEDRGRRGQRGQRTERNFSGSTMRLEAVFKLVACVVLFPADVMRAQTGKLTDPSRTVELDCCSAAC